VARRSNIAKDRGTDVTNKSDDVMIDLDSRPATLGTNINRFRVKNGDENVPYFSLRVLGIVLTDDEVDELLPFFTRAFFNTKGKTKTPMFPQFTGFQFRDNFEGATVRLTPGVNGSGKSIEVKGCKLKKLVFEPQAGGATLLSLTIIGPKRESLDRLDDRLDGEIHIAIEGAELMRKDDAQQDLPINTFGDDDRPAAH
jgi:hypothetical protein